MDQLPEPKFEQDDMFPRKLYIPKADLESQDKKYYMFFAAVSGFSIIKYFRDITFYDKKFGKFLAISVAFGYFAHTFASYRAYDPFYTATIRNNENEEKFILEYGKLLKEARDKNIQIPNELLY